MSTLHGSTHDGGASHGAGAHHGVPVRLSPVDRNGLGDRVASIQTGLGILGAAWAVGLLIGMNGWFGTEPALFWRFYLVSFCFILAISLGGLFFVMVQHLTRAGWSVTVRRPAELLAGNLRWIWALWVFPIGWLFVTNQAGQLWQWADPVTMQQNNPAEWALVAKKEGYFSLFGLFTGDFFWARAILYFVIWWALSRFFLKRSLRLGATGDRANVASMQKVAAPGMILFALSVTFAAFDWVMSISPAWFSTMFGVYFFVGCCTAGFAAMILLCVRLQSLGALQGLVSTEHYQDLGKLLFAFGVVFWAYIAYSQYMLIWYANIPEETVWFLPRQAGGWGMLSLALLFGHFVLPFLALISKWPKRMPIVLSLGAIWMLVFAWLDLYWLIMPEIPHDVARYQSFTEFFTAHANDSTHLFEPIMLVGLCLLVGMLGLLGYFTAGAARRLPLVCEGDPRLADAVRFENI